MHTAPPGGHAGTALGREPLLRIRLPYLDTSEKAEQEKRSLKLIDDSFRKIVVVNRVMKPYMDDDGIDARQAFTVFFGAGSKARSRNSPAGLRRISLSTEEMSQSRVFTNTGRDLPA